MSKKLTLGAIQLCVLSLALALFVSSCAPQPTPIPPINGPQPTPSSPPIILPTPLPPVSGEQVVQSKLVRIAAPSVPQGDLAQLVQGNSDFAMALYQQLRSGKGNLFFSPYSISLALAMTYAGARSDTESQMAQALHFTLPQERLHPALNSLDQTIVSYAQKGANQGQGFQLNIANSIWGQQDFTFLPAYLDLLAQNYGAGMHLLDFVHAAEPSRTVINNWVEQQTQGKITDLFPQGSIDDTTRLVLANAIYFKAAWENAFDPAGTQNGPFYLPDGSSTSVAMMSSGHEASYLYAQGDNYQAIGLPYQGGQVMMLVVMPSAGQFSDFESGLSEAQLEAILGGMNSQMIDLKMPKFKVESEIDLKSVLASLGMTDAFDQNADFSGMDEKKDLYISDVLHKAYVNVDEHGTEAAAATGIVVGMMAVPAQVLNVTIDHPFLFFIVDPQTKTILFMGRVMNPSQ
ncbi:MAG: serpin family protein [Anaerolineales bacterium]|jgi:serpin B